MLATGLGIKDWQKVSYRCEVDLNLDGYMGVVKSPMAAKDVFRRLFITAKVHDTSATEDQVAIMRGVVHSSCPIQRLFHSVGVDVHERWSLGDFEENSENPAGEGVLAK